MQTAVCARVSVSLRVCVMHVSVLRWVNCTETHEEILRMHITIMQNTHL